MHMFRRIVYSILKCVCIYTYVYIHTTINSYSHVVIWKGLANKLLLRTIYSNT